MLSWPSPSAAVQSAAKAFLDSLGNANAACNYGTGVGKTVEWLGETRPLATVADDEIGGVLEHFWDEAAVNTWKPAGHRRCRGWTGAASTRATARRCRHGQTGRPRRTQRPQPAQRWPIDSLIARHDAHLREKTLWRML
ncbi:hypothetical protein ACFVT1_30880 [Streptomyces sp. NPDC057963]|uniref:hypothetical protein n=1 Tax=Streptomyces sp. NPDC057963 TaxID=3346290 RepID=UPI0036EAF352